MYYTSGKTETHHVTGVSSYSYHGERVVRLTVAEYFSDVFYFSRRESFRFADNGDILTFMRDNETPHTRISFDCYGEEEEDEEEQLYYCYSLRSREKTTPTGEPMYGYRWTDDGYLTTFCYGRKQLKKHLTANMKVVRVSLAHNCKPRHTLP